MLLSLIGGQGMVTATKLGLTRTPFHSIQLDYLMQQTIPVQSSLLQAISQGALLQ